jgi:hypothetical protein
MVADIHHPESLPNTPLDELIKVSPPLFLLKKSMKNNEHHYFLGIKLHIRYFLYLTPEQTRNKDNKYSCCNFIPM